MSKTAKELIKEVLAKWEFPILAEDEHNLAFRYEMKIINAYQYSEELKAVALMSAGLFKCESDTEKILALKTCNDINGTIALAKTYIDSDDDLVVSAEFIYETPEDMEALLECALGAVINAKKRFFTRYQENQAEIELMSELKAACQDEDEEE